MIASIATWLIARNPAMTLAHARRLAKVGLVLLAALAVGALALWLNLREEADDRTNQQIGATAERTKQLEDTIKQVEKGNAARAEIEEALGRDDGRSRVVYDQCVRTARTPANCERFLPEREEAVR